MLLFQNQCYYSHIMYVLGKNVCTKLNVFHFSFFGFHIVLAKFYFKQNLPIKGHRVCLLPDNCKPSLLFHTVPLSGMAGVVLDSHYISLNLSIHARVVHVCVISTVHPLM